MSAVPTSAQDVIAVLDSSFTQVFERARAIKAGVARDSKPMEHPLETGAVVTDHRVILPISVELSLILVGADYKTVYQQIRDLFTRGELLTVQTRVDSFPSMLIEKMPHEETAEIYDGVMLALTLKEALFVTPQYSILPPSTVVRPKDASTVKRGQISPTETSAAQQETVRSQSVLGRLFN